MSQTQAFYDVWIVGSNLVYKEVPFHVISDWIQQVRITANDMLKPSGSQHWQKLQENPAFAAYISKPESIARESAVATEPLELDFNWKKSSADDDDDVDMIPLIDISLVLLIFFMMTTTVAAISKISVPEVVNGAKLESDQNSVVIQIDFQETRPIYGLGFGKAGPSEAMSNLSEEELFVKLDEHLATMTKLATITIAAHKDLTYEQVENVMKAIDRRKEAGVLIGKYNIQVGQKARS